MLHSNSLTHTQPWPGGTQPLVYEVLYFLTCLLLFRSRRWVLASGPLIVVFPFSYTSYFVHLESCCCIPYFLDKLASPRGVRHSYYSWSRVYRFLNHALWCLVRRFFYWIPQRAPDREHQWSFGVVLVQPRVSPAVSEPSLTVNQLGTNLLNGQIVAIKFVSYTLRIFSVYPLFHRNRGNPMRRNYETNTGHIALSMGPVRY